MVRIKHRYFLVHILSPTIPTSSASVPNETLPALLQFRRPSPPSLTPQLLIRAIRDQISLLYGDYGVGVTASGLSIKYLSPLTSTFILRCSRAHYQLVWAALTFLTQLPLPRTSKGPSRQPQLDCVLHVVRVSGTIRKVEEEAIRRARGDILRARREGEDGDGVLSEILGDTLGGGGGEEEDLEAEQGIMDSEEEESEDG